MGTHAALRGCEPEQEGPCNPLTMWLCSGPLTSAPRLTVTLSPLSPHGAAPAEDVQEGMPTPHLQTEPPFLLLPSLPHSPCPSGHHSCGLGRVGVGGLECCLRQDWLMGAGSLLAPWQ